MASVENSSSCMSQGKILRSTLIFATSLFVIFASHFWGTHRLRKSLCPQRGQVGAAMTTVSTERLLDITAKKNGLVYLPSSNILFMTMAKGGSTSIWNWLYLGTKGRKFTRKRCRTYVQNSNSTCWGKEAIQLALLPPEKRISILKSSKTLRVAIQRNPMSRIISSYKSKFACENFHNPNDAYYQRDINDRSRMVPELRRHAGFPEGGRCMNISEFASALQSARLKAGTPEGVVSSLRDVNPHIRPQEFYFDEIEYDLVLDTTDLRNTEYLKPIIKRLRYKELVEGGVKHVHGTKGNEVVMREKEARLLHDYALESKTGKRKLFTEKR